MPNPEVRGLVGLLIFVHLFSVAVALASYADTSPLENRLQQVLGPYSATLNFDLRPSAYPSGRFYLTHAEDADVDFSLEVEHTLPDGKAETLSIPMTGLWPGETRHYQALANAAGAMAVSPDVEPVLLRSIAGSVLRHWDATRGLVRVRQHKLVPLEAMSAADASLRDPFNKLYFNTVYEAHVLIGPTGEVDLVKRSAAGEVAPVEKPVEKGS